MTYRLDEITHDVGADLRTTYLGMRLASPIVASAGPSTGDPSAWPRLEAAGAGAIVLPSLFEEDVDRIASDAAASAHLSLVEDARERLSIPVIASLNGVTPGGWVRSARHLERAGAHAIELNLYDVITDPRRSAQDVERRAIEVVEEVRAEVDVPLAVKLGPWFTSLAHFAKELEAAGADGLVLFNRLCQPDIDLDTLTVVPRAQLSTSADLLLPLHWMAILREITPCSLAATSGVHDGADAMKVLLAGANVAMTTSAVLRRGPEWIRTMLTWMRAWMDERGFDSVDHLRGAVSQHDDVEAERSNYARVLRAWQ